MYNRTRFKSWMIVKIIEKIFKKARVTFLMTLTHVFH